MLPWCLLTLHDCARDSGLDGEGIEAWLSWEEEALRWRVPVEISRAELAELVERSTTLLERAQHRLIHESDFQRWGRRGGRETVRRYSTSWMAALALKRWGRIGAEELAAARVKCAA